MKDPDLIIIGAGQGGVALAGAMSRRGAKVLLFERSTIGGSCVNYGCTPSKAMLAAAHAVGDARRASRLGVRVAVRPDFEAVMRRVRKVRQRWRDRVRRIRDRDRVEVIDAEASFAGPRIVAADGREWTAQRIVIDTGTSPLIPPIEGLDGVPFLTNETFFDLRRLPPRTVVLGAGPMGVELGQALARLGGQVTLIDRAEQVLSAEAPEVSRLLEDALREDGVRLMLGCQVQRVSGDEQRIVVRCGDRGEVEAESLLVATGRRPNTEALCAERASIELDDRGFIKVDEQLRTTADGVFAIGECAGQAPFTHVSYEDHRRLLDIWEDGGRTRHDRVLSYAIFTDPQVGRAGLSAAQAERRGLNVSTQRQDLTEAGRNIEWEYGPGLLEIVADARTRRLLGATVVGHEACELVQIFIPLIEQRLTWSALAESVMIHPTYGEAIMSLARKFEEEHGARPAAKRRAGTPGAKSGRRRAKVESRK